MIYCKYMLKLAVKTLLCCVLSTIFLLYSMYYIIFFGKHYVSLFIFLVLILTILLTIKVINSNKNLLLRVSLLIFILILFFDFPTEFKQLRKQRLEDHRIQMLKDDCIEDYICVEGLTINANGRMITVNKQSCIENKGCWNETRKECNFRE